MVDKMNVKATSLTRGLKSPRACFAAAGCALLLAVVPARTARAESRTPDPSQKQGYHLFRPTPRHLMREMATDRPDVTESPYTVDAGHFQAELSFVEYGRDDDDGGDFEELAILPTNLKVGLTNNIDLQLVFTPYIDQDAGGDSNSGFGETQLRLKFNIWGNDGPGGGFDESALAIMPFLQFPTGDEDLGFADRLEGGVIVPFATPLPNEFSLGLMGELDLVRDSDDDGYELEFLHTASIGRDIVGDLGGYVEYIGIFQPGGYAAAVGAGLTYGLSPDVQLDAGLIAGLNEEAEDLRLFAGISFRL